MGLLGQYLPDWLPDDPTKNDAARQGLLSFGAAMLGGRGNFGQILGGGLAAGSGGYQAALQNSSLAAIRDAQLQGLKLQNQGVQGAMDQQKGILALLNGSGPPTSAPAAPPAASQLAGASPSAVAPLSALPQMSSTSAPPESNMSAAALLPQAPDQSNPDASGNDLSSQPQASAPSQFVTPPVAAPASSPIASLPQVGAAQNNALSAYQSAMAQAQMIQRAYGAGAAKPYFDAAKSMKPDAKEIKTVTLPDGSRVLAQFYSDGSPPQVVQGLSPDKEKLVGYGAGGTYNFADPFSGQTVNSAKMTATPDAIMSDATTRRGQNMVDARAKADQTEVPITADAITNAAARYNLDGTLPPMGMGPAAAAGRSAILNKAAELAAGIDPTEQRKNQIGAKNDLASKGAALKQFTSGKLGNTVRSFNVLQSHLDTFGNMAEALDNGNMQLVNKIGNAYATATGGAAPTNFEAIKHIVGDEIVKAVTGSAGALGDREAAAKTIASANSPAQLRGVIATYKELARGQLGGLQKQYETSTGRTDFNNLLTQSAQEARQAAPLSALPKKAAPAPVAITGAADYATLPSGTLYVAPDGHTRRKP